MTDQPPADEMYENGEDTLIVPPPGFRERLLAAQKARTSEIRQSVEIPNPLKKVENVPVAEVTDQPKAVADPQSGPTTPGQQDENIPDSPTVQPTVAHASHPSMEIVNPLTNPETGKPT